MYDIKCKKDFFLNNVNFIIEIFVQLLRVKFLLKKIVKKTEIFSFFKKNGYFLLKIANFLSQKESSQEILLRVESGQPKIGLTRVESSRVRTRKHH